MIRRAVSGIMLTLLLIGMLTLVFRIKMATAEPGLIIVPDHYPTIQQALSAANWWDTIYVRAGTYPGNIWVSIPIYLVGESAQNTIIDGSAGVDAIVVAIPAGVPSYVTITRLL